MVIPWIVQKIIRFYANRFACDVFCVMVRLGVLDRQLQWDHCYLQPVKLA